MIYTFYSYKGGVGRSMALANVAECFCERGVRVLIVDWDLEAPGLESFFFEPQRTEKEKSIDEAASIRSRLGVIDMLLSYKQAYSRLPLAAPPPPSPTDNSSGPASVAAQRVDVGKVLDEYLPPLSDFLTPIHRRPNGKESGGELWLLSAGWRQNRFSDYAHAVQSFDWNDFYSSFAGEAYFDWLRRQFARFDVVLIDSRTGVTEMGGVCARQLADVVVSFCAPNLQNVDGVAKMVHSFRTSAVIEARKNRPVDTVVIPARVELTESDRLERFQQLFHDQVETQSDFLPQVVSNTNRPLWDLHIPYIPKFAFLERRVVGPDSETDPTGHLPKAYWRLATQLAALAPPASPARHRFAVEIRQTFPQIHFGVLIAFAGNDGRAVADHVSNVLRSANIDVFEQIDRNRVEGDIGLAIENAESLAIVMTSQSMSSDRVRKDIRIARGAGRATYGIAPRGLALDSVPLWFKNVEVIQSGDTEGLVTRLGQRRTAERIPMMAPDLPDDAIRRDGVIKELKAAMGRQPIVALLGPVGIGKTLVTSQLCRDDDVVDAFPGGILWLKLDPSGSGPAHRRALYAALFGPDEEYDDVKGADRLARRLLGSRHLLVVDDAEKTRAVEEIIRLNAPGACLVLTRHAGVASGLASVVVKIGPFTHSEAAGILCRALGQEGATAPDHVREDIRDVVSQLGAWPAAIHLASAVLRQKVKEGLQPEEALAQVIRSMETHGVLAFDQNARSLGRPSLAPLLRAALAVLNPSDRRSLASLAEFGENASVQDAADLWGMNKRQANNLLRRLGAMSLVLYDDAGGTVSVPAPIASYLHPPQARTTRRQISSSLDRQDNPDVVTATAVLAGTTKLALAELETLFKSLKAARYFDLARRVIAAARDLPESRDDPSKMLRLVQQQALCTYKDTDLPADQRLDRALEILRTDAQLGVTNDQETLGLAGAIFKRKWEVDGQRENLDRALAYYRRGYQQGILTDDGYTAINAAFVLDQLAGREEVEASSLGVVAAGATTRRAEARKIREDIVRSLTEKVEKQRRVGKLENAWFLLGTLGEANFGLGRYDESLFWLREALEHQPADWEYETTARQLAEIARLQAPSAQGKDMVDSEAWSTLVAFLGDDAAAATSVGIGKVGLSLSGGGFRASLFHIGVLARLAECDLLRHVEVLSCVSGGSIIGAYYYLELRSLLQSKPDGEITSDDYVGIVKRMADNFLLGIQRNIRCRLASGFWANLKMALAPDYSTTQRLGELFEQELYARIEDGENHLPRWLNQLTIEPKGEGADFLPKLDNWRRAAKVPILILNATALNTGHNWQFTATWMGESPTNITSEIDANDRLRRLYYWQAPEPYQRFSLGHAVAASACVPGLFEPLPLPGLYPDRVVQLVDGGVQDNQGVGGLLEQDCVIFLVSDASGQMQSINRPRSELVDVPVRANHILMARVRDAEFRELEARRRASLIRGLMFLHLEKDLDITPVDWIGAQSPLALGGDGTLDSRSSLTSYGINKSMQNRLAAIRTDLDSFNDIEAFALMTSGYLMAKAELPHAFKSVEGMQPDGPAVDWRFLDVRDQLAGQRERGRTGNHFTRVLEVGGSRMLKAFRLAPFRAPLVLAPWVALALVAILSLYQLGLLLASWIRAPQVLPLAALPAGGLFGWGMSLWLARRKTLTQFFIGLLLALFGWIGRLHLISTDRLYRQLGAVTATRLGDILELAKQYDRVRTEMPPGAARTRRMTVIFEAMTAQAGSVRRFLPELQGSESPGSRLAAIAVLHVFPLADQLDWLASRLDPELEEPFVGYQAAAALQQAVRVLPRSEVSRLADAISKAKRLAELNPDDPPRINMLATAQRELARKYPQGEPTAPSSAS